MDELDKLKAAWKSQDYSKEKVSAKDIYKMLHAKSSSYVKWIFYISIIEFVLLNSLYLSPKYKNDIKFYKELDLGMIMTVIGVISTIIVLFFIYRFYINYKNIKVDSSSKALMQSILKTRRTVKNYIYFNIGMAIVLITIVYSKIFSNAEAFRLYKLNSNIPDINTPSDLSMKVMIIFATALMILIIFLFYRLVYGILLRRLKKNYKELEQLDK
ncbi:hypothetical protein [Urechidicola croceus]|uniref:Beta-carotene 15,15'-monooxygenase n=1 Tax=Urechidicola croceus TaxID=1850246 RepID=A0A1D8P5R6_9FLAO|nr:hypothetical protein [Urechidicola croceus]AOW19900.1 hypothetical protein LPB138_04035 [Urechidicola croceus]